MKRDIKVQLQDAFEAPVPEQKAVFLREISHTQVSTIDFVKSQLFYIRKRVWGLSLLILAAALVCVHFMERNSLWTISALVPFIALGAVMEETRSASYGMWELEQSARFSLKSVTLARMLSIGLVHLGMLGVLIPLAGEDGSLSLWKCAVYLLVPYLLTTMSGLIAVRKLPHYQGSYVCTGCAALVSMFCMYTRGILSWVYEEKYFVWWCVLALYLMGSVYKEYKRMIYQTEDFAWN